MLLFCKKNNVEVSAYSVLTPTFIIGLFIPVKGGPSSDFTLKQEKE